MKHATVLAMIAAAVSATPAAAEFVSNPVTDYQVSIFRTEGGSHDFQGWIRLLNGTADAGYIYIQNGLPLTPRLGSTKYVVIDIPVSMLGDTLDMLRSGKPVFITYRDVDGQFPSAFLHVGSDALPLEEQSAFIAQTFKAPAAAFTAAP